MVALPADIRTKTEKLIEDAPVEPEVRSYLGISSIGDSCPRKLWYRFRLCGNEKINQRQKRLFSRGHKEEPIIIEDLERIGIEVHSDQKGCSAGNGHIKGHIDGLADKVPDAPKTTHLLEFKTANEKSYKAMRKDGLKKSKPIYYAQVVCYMYLLKLKRCLFIMVNKNDDSRYYERVPCDTEKAKELIQRGVDIISTDVPPEKIAGPTWYECKWCPFYDICHFGEEPSKNCRTCTHCDIHDEGKWKCSKYYVDIAFEHQKRGCRDHDFLESLL